MRSKRLTAHRQVMLRKVAENRADYLGDQDKQDRLLVERKGKEEFDVSKVNPHKV